MKQFILSILILTSTSLYAQCQGDTNEDGTVNVADIVETVNIIFDGNTDCEEETDNLYDVTINFDMDSIRTCDLILCPLYNSNSSCNCLSFNRLFPL